MAADLTPLEIPGENVRRWRERRGMEVSTLAGLVGHKRAWLWEIETGRTRLEKIGDVLAICRVLKVSLDTLCNGSGLTAEESHALSPVPALTGLDVPWTAWGALSALREITEDEVKGMDRRGFLVATTAAATHGMLVAPAVADVSRTGGASKVTDAVIDAIEQTIVSLRALDNQLGGPRVVYRDPLRIVRDLLANGTYTDRIGRRLHAVAAELLRLCGWVAYDSNDVGRAQRYWVAGAKQAKVAGDTAMGAHIIASLANLSRKASDFGSAVAQAEDAKMHYSGESPKVKARLHLQAAMCYASVGDRLRCQRDLGAAEDLVPRFGDPSPEWASWIDDGVVANDAGQCYAKLRDTRRGVEYLQRGLAKHQGFPRDEALFHAHLAVAAAADRKPDLDLAVSAANSAMDLLDGIVVSPRCFGEVREAGALIYPWRQKAEVKQTLARIRSLSGRAA